MVNLYTGLGLCVFRYPHTAQYKPCLRVLVCVEPVGWGDFSVWKRGKFLSSNPPSPREKLGIVVHICNPIKIREDP